MSSPWLSRATLSLAWTRSTTSISLLVSRPKWFGKIGLNKCCNNPRLFPQLHPLLTSYFITQVSSPDSVFQHFYHRISGCDFSRSGGVFHIYAAWTSLHCPFCILGGSCVFALGSSSRLPPQILFSIRPRAQRACYCSVPCFHRFDFWTKHLTPLAVTGHLLALVRDSCLCKHVYNLQEP